MKEPTQEQIREFWEWCGFEYKHEEIVDASASKVFVTSLWLNGIEQVEPHLDLNSIFKYAVPKLHAYCLQSFSEGHKNHHVTIVPYPYKNLQDMKTYGATVSREEDPALALFWAIWEVIEGEG